MSCHASRRRFLQSSIACGGLALAWNRPERARGFDSANDRPTIGAIGTGSRWSQQATGIDGPHGSAPEFRQYGDYVAVCDADRQRRDAAADIVRGWTGKAPSVHADYRALIDNSAIDLIHISTPDHWHAKIAIEAMRAGKDVYCEKPMTLTIDEGKQICDVCEKTGRIVQVGTQQRSQDLFLQAIALIRAGRLGRLQKAICGIGGGPTSPVLPVVAPPPHLDWNLWQGPVPEREFRYLAGDNGETQSWSRCHYEFRWWYEYSGGKLTDWGAHHVDIATWGLDKTQTGPISVDPIAVKHPVPFQDGQPMDGSRYNTATEFLIRAKYADDTEIEIRHDGDNGILFVGTEGRIFVNRGKLVGGPVDDLDDNPLPDGALEAVYKNRPLVDHFRNFVEAARDRFEPISDVFSHHRALTTCHLAGIAARLNRRVAWNPDQQRIPGDDQAQSMLAREYRQGFEIG